MASLIEAIEIKRKMFFEYEGAPYHCLDVEVSKPTARGGQTLGSRGVHILDPFTGTGTFITRLLQSGLIQPEDLPRKFASEIHANEIVLLAYYIAAINIEPVYHSIMNTPQPEDVLPHRHSGLDPESRRSS